MRFMAWSNETWQPFEYDSDKRHDCSESRSVATPASRNDRRLDLSPAQRQLLISRQGISGPVQSFVDGIGTEIVDLNPGTFRDSVVARQGFTFRCPDRDKQFTIDGGNSPALVVDAGDAVVTFRGIRFVSTSSLGAVVVLSGGVRLEQCSIEAGALGLDIASSDRSSHLLNTDLTLTGQRSKGIRVGPHTRLHIANVSIRGATLSELDVDPRGTVDGWINRPPSSTPRTTAHRAPNQPSQPVRPTGPSPMLLLAQSLGEMSRDYHERASALLDSLDALPDEARQPHDLDRVWSLLEVAQCCVDEVSVRLEPLLEPAE
ncbi:MAG TPA: hypothetical protein VGT61_13590 [Thermomicrobiales bacterium]|jgi:hypothetical protein|nr:hypothetical protein [Thermomicrobiales bacterium]